MNTILVGVDGSAEATAAAEFAAGLAAQTGAHLLLAYTEPIYPTDNPELRERFSASERDFAEKMLTEAKARHTRPGVAVESIVSQGDAAGQLAARALEADIDLVVVGHRGRGAVKRMLLGSVADRLVQISPKPVLVVR